MDHTPRVTHKSRADLGVGQVPGARPRYYASCACGTGDVFPYSANDTNRNADACLAAHAWAKAHLAEVAARTAVPA